MGRKRKEKVAEVIPESTASLSGERKFSMSYNGEKVSFNDYFRITVSYDNGFKFYIGCRGHSLKRELAFQNQLKWASYQVEKITEKEYLALSH